MKNKVYEIGGYICAFTLGVYADSQFKFNTPIEFYKWVVALILFAFFVRHNFKNKL